jgi:hypothetical protein
MSARVGWAAGEINGFGVGRDILELCKDARHYLDLTRRPRDQLRERRASRAFKLPLSRGWQSDARRLRFARRGPAGGPALGLRRREDEAPGY